MSGIIGGIGSKSGAIGLRHHSSGKVFIFAMKTSLQDSIVAAETGTPLVYDAPHIDITGSFTQATGTFTAPHTGYYLFDYGHATYPPHVNVNRMYIWINGSKKNRTQLRIDPGGATGYLWGSRQAAFKLSAGGVAQLKGSIDGSTGSGDSAKWMSDTTLSDYLIIREIN